MTLRTPLLLPVWLALAITLSRAQGTDTLVIDAEQKGNAALLPPHLVGGYRRSVSGQTISYHSSHPDVDDALLCRVRRDADTIAWESDTLPAIGPGEAYRLVWLAGIERIGWGNATHPHTFHLSVNGRRWFTFTNRKDSTAPKWSIGGPEGAELSFESHMVDNYGDLFGFMYLTLPGTEFPPGRPLELRVDGEDADSPEWYMTFQHPFDLLPRVRVEPALVREEGGVRSLLRLSLDNLEEQREVKVSMGGRGILSRELAVGANIFLLPVPAVSTGKELQVVFNAGGRRVSEHAVTLKPVKHLEIYLLSHTHNDIGYTDIQPNVERKQWDNLDRAIELIGRTASYPEGSRFKWNLEILWPFASYMQQASEAQRERVLRLIRSGSIGLNALFINPLTGLATAEEMSRFTFYARKFSSEYSIPITTAAVSDVPGFTWGIVPALAQSGVRYFASAPNTGDRIGYVLQAWGDRPFYWESQSGNQKVLFWVAGSGYSLFHRGSLSQFGEEKIMKLVRKITEEGYPYDMYDLPYTLGDNGGPDSTLPAFVRDWNERYVTPTLRIATHQEMFRKFERRYGKMLPVRRGDFTPYWEDGAASTAFETALNRQAADRLIQGAAVWSMRSPQSYPESLYDNAWEKVILWDEHTWGADKSVSDPDDPGVKEQWRIKRNYAVGADSLSRLLLERALSSAGAADTFDIYNTNAWTRSGVIFLSPARSRAGDRVADEAGNALFSQRLSTGELAVVVTNVPPMSAKRISISPGEPRPGGTIILTPGGMKNDHIALAVDTSAGTIRSLTAGGGGTECVEQGKGLGTYLYVGGKDPGGALSLANVHVRFKERGEVLSSMVVTADAPGCRSYSCEIRLVTGLDRVEITTTLDKLAVRTPEGVHIAFPFDVPHGELRYDVADAVVRFGEEQLAGACKNFLSVQSFVDLSNDARGITWASADAPLVEVGTITAESPWLKELEPSQRIYSYVMNNYWHTNYKADQSGPVTFRYAVRAHGAFDPTEAVRFARELREPLIVAPASPPDAAAPLLSLLDPGELIVQSVRPVHAGRDLLLLLYNPAGSPRKVTLRQDAAQRVALFSSSGSGDAAKEEQGGAEVGAYDSSYLLVRKK